MCEHVLTVNLREIRAYCLKGSKLKYISRICVNETKKIPRSNLYIL